jgi:hypothetical protein
VKIGDIPLSPFLVTAGTYPMRWVSTLIRFLNGKNMKSRPWSYQLIALLFLFPALKLHELLFEIVYFLNQRRLLRLGLQQAALSFGDMVSQLNQLRLNGCDLSQANNRLNELMADETLEMAWLPKARSTMLILLLRNEFLEFPNPINNAGSHRRRHTKGPMNQTEVIGPEIQCNSGLQIH